MSYDRVILDSIVEKIVEISACPAEWCTCYIYLKVEETIVQDIMIICLKGEEPICTLISFLLLTWYFFCLLFLAFLLSIRICCLVFKMEVPVWYSRENCRKERKSSRKSTMSSPKESAQQPKESAATAGERSTGPVDRRAQTCTGTCTGHSGQPARSTDWKCLTLG